MAGAAHTGPVGPDVFAEIQRFLADEADLLDRRAFADWFDLLTPEISYRVSVHVLRRTEDGPKIHDIIDEDSDNLRLRVDQLATPRLTKAENPPSLYRRLVTNIRADHAGSDGAYAVRTNLLVYKNRHGNTELYAGEREDLLRRVDGRLRIASRRVRLDQSVLQGGTLSTLL